MIPWSFAAAPVTEHPTTAARSSWPTGHVDATGPAIDSCPWATGVRMAGSALFDVQMRICNAMLHDVMNDNSLRLGFIDHGLRFTATIHAKNTPAVVARRRVANSDAKCDIAEYVTIEL